MQTLERIYADIDDRVEAMLRDYAGWPCRRGCDGCCRRLAEIPTLTRAEWERLQEGLAALSPEKLWEISGNIDALARQPSRPIVCPLLDRSQGICRVYAHRPAACRTYGFYVQRGTGLYCQEIEARVDAGEWPGTVWGNHDAIDRRLKECGETRELTRWFADGWGNE